MNRMYRYLCWIMLGVLLAALLISLIGAAFSAGRIDGSEVSVPEMQNGTFYGNIENWFRSNFPGRKYFMDQYENLVDWYTLVDEPSAE